MYHLHAYDQVLKQIPTQIVDKLRQFMRSRIIFFVPYGIRDLLPIFNGILISSESRLYSLTIIKDNMNHVCYIPRTR